MVVLCAVQFSLALQPAAAEAPKPSDSTSRVLVFSVADKSGKNNADLEKAVRKAVADVPSVKLLDTPRKKLADAQGTAQCHDQSAGCLRAISQQLGAEILLAPTLDRGPDDLVLTLLMFDGRKGDKGTVSEVAHWQDGTKLSQETMRALPQLVQGLFNPSQPDAVLPLVAAAPEAAAPAAQPSAAHGSRDVSRLYAPLSLLGGGVVVLAAGIVTGAVMRGTEDKYNALEVQTRDDAKRAASLLSSAKTEATVSKLCFGVSAVAIAAGAAWLSYQLFGADQPERQLTRIAPLVSQHEVGLVVRYQGGAL